MGILLYTRHVVKLLPLSKVSLHLIPLRLVLEVFFFLRLRHRGNMKTSLTSTPSSATAPPPPHPQGGIGGSYAENQQAD